MNRGTICAIVMLGMVIASEGRLNATWSAPADFSATDVSPDSRFGDSAAGSEQTGRITTVIVDPGDPAILYAASEFAGIWKSTDAAHTWFQSSQGLTTGESGTTPTVAIDETGSRRLTFASGQDDYRPGNPSGGVWVSTDAGGSWRHAVLSGCRSPLAYRVAFGGGHAYAVTNCGLATSNTPDLMNWTLLPTAFRVDVNSYVCADEQSVFVSSGAKVYRGAWAFGRLLFTGSAVLAGNSVGLAAAPRASPSGQPLVAAIHMRGTAIDVSSISFADSGARVSSLGFWARQPPFPNRGRGHFCCGVDGVFLTRRPTRKASSPGYDVFASDGYRFYQYLPRKSPLLQGWATIANIHPDVWSMAFPSTYDPAGGNCTAYSASDGGIRVSMGRPGAGRSCFTGQGPWVLAQSGLHAFGGTSIVGWEQPPCGNPQHNCPILYLSGSDNATWVSTSGGVPGRSWSAMPCCGDSGSATLDWASRSQLVINRNGFREVFRSSNGQPPTPSTDHRNMAENRPDLVEGAEPPQQASFSQVMTLTAEADARPIPPEVRNGDYVQVSSKNPGDTIVRTTDRTTWKDLSPNHHFPLKTVKAVATSNGHKQLVVYILTSSSASGTCTQSGDVLTIRKGKVDGSGTIKKWEIVSGLTDDSNRISRARDLWVNPYDPQQLYVTDLGGTGSGSIKYSSDGGISWRVESELGMIATNNGEFRFGCFGAWCSGRRFCSLQQVLFSRDHPGLRIAILFPGGVGISRDGGETWSALGSLRGGSLKVGTLRELLAYPYSGYLDTSSDTNRFSLYLAIRGRGLIRIDGQF